MRLSTIFIVIFLISIRTSGQIPNGYYNSAEGLTGTPLKSALHDIIDDHLAKPYGTIDVYFPTLDAKPNGKVWDIYSYVFTGLQPYEYTFGTHECDAGLNYNSEGDCFNKEHIWPQSKYNQQMPMRSDLHQLVPTDGWVNNKRAAYPFGDVSNVSWTSDNGSLLGTSQTYTGYTDKVFEPIDSFKGDVARMIFYMVTRYHGESSNWTDWEMANGGDLTDDAIALLRAWHTADPVSQKEADRNNAIYNIQSNRNPFVDYPFLVDCIWGNDCTPLSVNQSTKEEEIQINNGVIFLPRHADIVHVINSTGQMVAHFEDIDKFATNELSEGIYVLYIQTDEQISTFKFSVHQ